MSNNGYTDNACDSGSKCKDKLKAIIYKMKLPSDLANSLGSIVLKMEFCKNSQETDKIYSEKTFGEIKQFIFDIPAEVDFNPVKKFEISAHNKTFYFFDSLIGRLSIPINLHHTAERREWFTLKNSKDENSIMILMSFSKISEGNAVEVEDLFIKNCSRSDQNDYQTLKDYNSPRNQRERDRESTTHSHELEDGLKLIKDKENLEHNMRVFKQKSADLDKKNLIFSKNYEKLQNENTKIELEKHLLENNKNMFMNLNMMMFNGGLSFNNQNSKDDDSISKITHILHTFNSLNKKNCQNLFNEKESILSATYTSTPIKSFKDLNNNNPKCSPTLVKTDSNVSNNTTSTREISIGKKRKNFKHNSSGGKVSDSNTNSNSKNSNTCNNPISISPMSPLLPVLTSSNSTNSNSTSINKNISKVPQITKISTKLITQLLSPVSPISPPIKSSITPSTTIFKRSFNSAAGTVKITNPSHTAKKKEYNGSFVNNSSNVFGYTNMGHSGKTNNPKALMTQKSVANLKKK